MAVKTRAQLIIDINNILTSNANNEITGALMNQLIIDINDSLVNSQTDAGLLGLSEFDVAKDYSLGSAVIYDSKIYQAGQNITAGAWDVTKWTLLTTVSDPVTDYTFVPFDNLATYNIDDRVEYQNKLFKCDANGTVGIIPIDTAPEWSEVSANTGIFGEPHATGTYYLTGDVVTHTDNKLYKMVSATSPFYSTDFATELGANDWALFHDVSGGGLNLENVLNTGNNTGSNDINIAHTQVINFLNAVSNVADVKLINSDLNPNGFVFESQGTLVSDKLYLIAKSKNGQAETGFTFETNGLNGGLRKDTENKVFLESVGEMSISATGDVVLNTGINKKFQFKKQLEIQEKRDFNFGLIANSVSDYFIRFGTGVLNSISQSYNVLFRDMKSDQAIAFLSDFAGINKLIIDIQTTSLILGVTPTLIPLATFTIVEDGDYFVEWVGEVVLTGDSDATVTINKNGNPQNGAVGSAKENQDAGGSPKDVITNIIAKSVKFSALNGDVISANGSNSGVVSTITNGLFKVTKVL